MRPPRGLNRRPARLPLLVLVLLTLPCLQLATAETSGTFDNSWYLSFLPPSSSSVTAGGVLLTHQSNPNTNDYSNSYYDTAQIGSFPWKGQPSTPAINDAAITVTLKFQNRTLQPNSHYSIYVGLYYYLPDGIAHGCNNTLDHIGCRNYDWFDTEARLADNANGADSSIGKENTYSAGDSFGYDKVLANLQPGQLGNLTNLNVETQFDNAATNWNIDPSIPHKLMGVEVGTSGYAIQTLNVDWYTVQLTNLTQTQQPSGPTSPSPSPGPISSSQPTPTQATCPLCQISGYVESHLWLIVVGVLLGFTIPIGMQRVARRLRKH